MSRCFLPSFILRTLACSLIHRASPYNRGCVRSWIASCASLALLTASDGALPAASLAVPCMPLSTTQSHVIALSNHARSAAMEVRLHDDATGGPRPFALQLQRRAGKLGVLLTAADGAGERYMLSDAVSGVELSEDDFIGRVRACFGSAQPPLALAACSALRCRAAARAVPPLRHCGLSSRAPGLRAESRRRGDELSGAAASGWRHPRACRNPRALHAPRCRALPPLTQRAAAQLLRTEQFRGDDAPVYRIGARPGGGAPPTPPPTRAPPPEAPTPSQRCVARVPERDDLRRARALTRRVRPSFSPPQRVSAAAGFSRRAAADARGPARGRAQRHHGTGHGSDDEAAVCAGRRHRRRGC